MSVRLTDSATCAFFLSLSLPLSCLSSSGEQASERGAFGGAAVGSDHLGRSQRHLARPRTFRRSAHPRHAAACQRARRHHEAAQPNAVQGLRQPGPLRLPAHALAGEHAHRRAALTQSINQSIKHCMTHCFGLSYRPIDR